MHVRSVSTSAPSSDGPRTAAALVHVFELAIAFAILDRSGAPAGRVGLLATFAALSWFAAAHRLACRPGTFSRGDALVTTIFAGAYQLGFAWLASRSSAPLGAVDAVATLLFLGGTGLSAASDRVRRRFHAEPENAQRLCAAGPFAVVRYPTYLAGLVQSSGWALATRSATAWLVVAAHAAVLLLVYAPALDRRLAGRHRGEFRAWASRTWRVLPLVY